MYWLGIADAKGWFKEAGLVVQLVDADTDYLASVKDLAKGRFDVNDLVLFDLLDSVARGADLVGVINVDYSSGADKLIARPGIEQLADLKGKRIALPQKSYLSYILEVAIARRAEDERRTDCGRPSRESARDPDQGGGGRNTYL